MSIHTAAPMHGGQLRQLAACYGIPAEQLFDFSVNVNPVGPPQSAIEAIRAALDKPTILTSYPDLELTELKQTISDCIGVELENIAVANGFVPLLDSALRAFSIRRCLLPIPSFNEYRRALRNAGVEVIPHRLLPEKVFEYEVDRIRKEIDSSCDAILLANPQNPSGTACDAEKMQRLIEIAAERGAIVMVDEAFVDYCPSASIVRPGVELKNVIVFRSVTKFFAIPGLRIAYAVSTSAKIGMMNDLIAPWPVSNIASIAVCAALKDRDYAEETRFVNERRRLWLVEQLARLGVATYPSSANFLLLQFPAAIQVDVLWERMIVEERIVLRSCTNFEGLEPGHLRIAVRSDAENEMLIQGLERVLGGRIHS